MREDPIDRYQTIVQHSSDVVSLVDGDGVIRYESPSVERVLGYAPDDLLGECVFDYVHPEDRERVVRAFEEVVRSSEPVTRRAEFRGRNADGSWSWLEAVTSNRPGSSRDEYVINSRDVTERKRYERRLEEQSEELEALNRLLRHDIRNDMTVVLGWAEELEAHVDETGRSHLQRIITNGEHVVELTRLARDYAEMLSRKGEMETEPVSLRTVLRNEVALRRESFPEATFDCPGEIPDVAVDANEMLRSVFGNLLNNAVQHNDADRPVVEVSWNVRDEDVLVYVADNGPGVPDDRKDAIFGKGDGGLEGDDTGIGLYLVQRLVSQYDGHVWVEDGDPDGAVFVVELPRAE
jgi:PAS domain S-box-containing protein